MEIRLSILWFLLNIKYQHDIENDFFVLLIHILLYVYMHTYHLVLFMLDFWN